MSTDSEARALIEAASPTPWYYDGRDIFSEAFQEGGHRLVLPIPETWHPSQAVNLADVQLIVVAVNAFAERVKNL